MSSAWVQMCLFAADFSVEVKKITGKQLQLLICCSSNIEVGVVRGAFTTVQSTGVPVVECTLHTCSTILGIILHLNMFQFLNQYSKVAYYTIIPVGPD